MSMSPLAVRWTPDTTEAVLCEMTQLTATAAATPTPPLFESPVWSEVSPFAWLVESPACGAGLGAVLGRSRPARVRVVPDLVAGLLVGGLRVVALAVLVALATRPCLRGRLARRRHRGADRDRGSGEVPSDVGGRGRVDVVHGDGGAHSDAVSAGARVGLQLGIELFRGLDGRRTRKRHVGAGAEVGARLVLDDRDRHRRGDRVAARGAGRVLGADDVPRGRRDRQRSTRRRARERRGVLDRRPGDVAREDVDRRGRADADLAGLCIGVAVGLVLLVRERLQRDVAGAARDRDVCGRRDDRLGVVGDDVERERTGDADFVLVAAGAGLRRRVDLVLRQPVVVAGGRARRKRRSRRPGGTHAVPFHL